MFFTNYGLEIIEILLTIIYFLTITAIFDDNVYKIIFLKLREKKWKVIIFYESIIRVYVGTCY